MFESAAMGKVIQYSGSSSMVKCLFILFHIKIWMIQLLNFAYNNLSRLLLIYLLFSVAWGHFRWHRSVKKYEFIYQSKGDMQVVVFIVF